MKSCNQAEPCSLLLSCFLGSQLLRTNLCTGEAPHEQDDRAGCGGHIPAGQVLVGDNSSDETTKGEAGGYSKDIHHRREP